MLVMTAMVGSMMSRSRATSPGTLAPASTTSASVSSGALRIESGTDHFLGARFAARPRDGDNRRALGQHAAPRPRQPTQRHERVVHLEEGQPLDFWCPAPDDRGRGTLRFGFVEERVSVKSLALEGDEQVIGYRLSGIGDYAFELELRRRRDPQCTGNLVARPRPPGHQFAPRLRTTSRSSNGSLTVPTT